MAETARRSRDLPYCDGEPVELSVTRWLVILAFTAAGFAALMATPHIWPGRGAGWAASSLFVLLPLLGLRLTAGSAWSAIFRRPTASDVWIGLAFAPLTLMVSGTVALAMMQASLTTANPAIALMLDLHGLGLAGFFATTGLQLLGEELVTVLPLLALLTLFRHGLRAPRRAAVLAAWIGSALIFGALHLSTYQWHFGQALLIIGAARLMLSIPFLITKNLWSSFIAHLVHDWSLFALVLAGTALRGG